MFDLDLNLTLHSFESELMKAREKVLNEMNELLITGNWAIENFADLLKRKDELDTCLKTLRNYTQTGEVKV